MVEAKSVNGVAMACENLDIDIGWDGSAQESEGKGISNRWRRIEITDGD